MLNINEALDTVPTHDDMLAKIRAANPDFLAFSVMTQQYKYALDLGKFLKKRLPDMPIAVGGVHTIMCTEQVKNDRFGHYIGPACTA